MSKAIMQQALDALKNGKRVKSGEGGTKYQPDLEDDAIAALEAELAKPEQKIVKPRSDYRDWDYQDLLDNIEQEPVAWRYKGRAYLSDPSEWASPEFVVTPLYTAPPRKEWVGLTDDEIENIYKSIILGELEVTRWLVCRAIEAKLKKKNK